MSAIIVPRRWTQPPSGIVAVDWSNSITRGLTNASYLPSATDAATNRKLNVTGTKILPTKSWPARAFGTVGAASTDLITTGQVGAVNATGGRTVLISMQTTAFTNGRRIYCRTVSASSPTSEIIVFGASNVINYGRYTGAAEVGNSSFSAGVVGNAQTFLIANDGVTNTNTVMFRDGVSVARAGPGSTLSTTPLSSDVYNFGNGPLGTNPMDGYISLVLIWDRFLSRLESLEITRNPWQIFKPTSNKIYIDAAVTAATFNPAWARNRSQVIGAGAH